MSAAAAPQPWTSGAHGEDPHQQLLDNLRANLPRLKDLLGRVDDLDSYCEDLVYRFWHQSFKMFSLQNATTQIAETLREAGGGAELNGWYLTIVSEGTGHTFQMSDNDQWLERTRPIVEAYFHSLHLLRLAVRYAETLDVAPNMLPSGWATLLHLYRIR